MAVNSTDNKVTYTGNDIATTFPYAFKIFANTELVVDKVTIATEEVETLTLTDDYTVDGVGESSGGNVILGSALLDEYKLVIRRVLPLTQLVDYVENESAPAETYEEAYDRDTMIAQQLQEQIDRCLKMKVYSSGVTVVLPDPQAGYYLAWNDDGDALENVAVVDVGDIITDTDGTLAANSNLRIATQKATKTYVDTSIAVNTEDAKTTPISADIVLIEDSADVWARKKATIGNVTKALDIANMTEKVTPVAADELLIADTEAADVIKKVTAAKIVAAGSLWEIDGTETQLKTADEIDMQSKKIINLLDPTGDQDAATKKYVTDNFVGGTGISMTGHDVFTMDFNSSSAWQPWITLAVPVLADSVIYYQWAVRMAKHHANAEARLSIDGTAYNATAESAGVATEYYYQGCSQVFADAETIDVILQLMSAGNLAYWYWAKVRVVVGTQQGTINHWGV